MNIRHSIAYIHINNTFIKKCLKLTINYYNSSSNNYQNLREDEPNMTYIVTNYSLKLPTNYIFFLFLIEIPITVKPPIILITAVTA